MSKSDNKGFLNKIKGLFGKKDSEDSIDEYEERYFSEDGEEEEEEYEDEYEEEILDEDDLEELPDKTADIPIPSQEELQAASDDDENEDDDNGIISGDGWDDEEDDISDLEDSSIPDIPVDNTGSGTIDLSAEVDPEDMIDDEVDEDAPPPQVMQIERPESDDLPDIPVDMSEVADPSEIEDDMNPTEIPPGELDYPFEEKPNFFNKLKSKTSGSLSKLTQSLKAKQGSPQFENFLKNVGEKINIDQIFTKTFSPESRAMIHKGFLATLICTSTYMGGKMIALFITPKKIKSSKSPIASITTRNDASEFASIDSIDLFKAEGKLTEVPKKDEGPVKNFNEKCFSANSKSSLPIKLLHTIVLMDEVKSMASVQVRSGKDIEAFRTGDKIQSMARLDKIEARKLILKNLTSSECEYIESSAKNKSRRGSKKLNILSSNQGKKVIDSQNSTGIKNVGNTFKIKKTVRDEMLGNMDEVLTQARAIQIKNPDGSLAFKMTEIVPGSIYSKLNIQNDDIITSINGKKFNNLGEVLGLFNQITEIDDFQITLDRGGSTQTLEYSFE